MEENVHRDQHDGHARDLLNYGEVEPGLVEMLDLPIDHLAKIALELGVIFEQNAET